MSEELRTLIAETKRLDGEARPGPWRNNCAKEKWLFDSMGDVIAVRNEDAALIAAYRTLAPKLADALEKALDQQEALLRLLVKSDAKILDLSEENRVMREALTLTEACEQAAACKIEQLTEENRIMREALFYIQRANGSPNDEDYVTTMARETLDTINRQRESKGSST